jgi:phage I-like protein
MSRYSLGFSVFELPSELKDEFQILPYGDHQTIDGTLHFVFTPDDAQEVISVFKARGIEMLNDWEHQSIAHLPGFEQFKAPDGRAPAAGWNGNLEARPDGLWATKVRWTPDAIHALKTGSYRYYSPVMAIEDGHVRAIQSVGLTNEPRIQKIPALAARSDLGEFFSSLTRECDMPLKDELVGALALAANASDQDILGAVKTLKDKATTGDTAAGELTAFKSSAGKLETQVSALTSDKSRLEGELTAMKTTVTGLQASLAETVLNYAEETGRITPASRAAFKPMVDKDPAAALVAFKAMAAGAAVPTGRLDDSAGKKPADLAGAEDPAVTDHLVAARGTMKFDPERKKVHDAAISLQRKNPSLSYVEAVTAVTRKA